MFLARKRILLNKSFTSTIISINGIGKSRAKGLLIKLMCTRKTIMKHLPREGLQDFANFVDKHFSTDELIADMEGRILKETIKNGSYRGMRMSQGLPSHGQRTHSNHRTARKRKASYLNAEKSIF